MRVLINGILQGQAPPVAHFREQQPANTNGGNFVAANWRQRVLNTTITNSIPGASLASNTVRLPAGMYDIVWAAPGVSCNAHISRLFNATSGAQVALGQSALANSAATNLSTSYGRAWVTLARPSDLRVEHFCATTRNTDGLGRPANLDGQPEVYTEIWILKCG